MESKEGGSLQKISGLANRTKARLQGFFRRNRINSNIPDSSQTETTSEPFNLSDFHYIRDSLYQLQTRNKLTKDGFTEVILPTETPEVSSWVGLSGTWLVQETILGLREGRLNPEGQPYVLCVDEVSDGQVLKGATEEERSISFTEAIGRVPGTLWLADQLRSDSYILSATALASVLFNLNQSQSIELVAKAVESSDLTSEQKRSLQDGLYHLVPSRIKNVTDYLRSARQRLIAEDKEYASAHGARQVKEATEGPIEIDGKEFEITGPGQVIQKAIEVRPEELTLINSFHKAIHEGRQEMVRRARLFAHAYLGEDEANLKIANPPDWFTNHEDEGLRSDEILLFFPKSIFEQIQQRQAALPDFIHQLYTAGINLPGWYKLKIAVGDNKITEISRLNNSK